MRRFSGACRLVYNKALALQQARHAQPTPSGDMMGIDVGIARFATLSDGSFYAPRNSFKKQENALRKAQQCMSRKVKFSQNWKKAKAKVQTIFEENADVVGAINVLRAGHARLAGEMSGAVMPPAAGTRRFGIIKWLKSP